MSVTATPIPAILDWCREHIETRRAQGYSLEFYVVEGGWRRYPECPHYAALPSIFQRRYMGASMCEACATAFASLIPHDPDAAYRCRRCHGTYDCTCGT